MMNNHKELYRQLGYSFKNKQFIKIALTHRSSEDENNERLEFLGDSIVNCVIAEALYHYYPDAQEGELSRWRASLVNRDALANIAREFQIGRYLLLGAGELKSGGKERSSILSCAMEAIIGAIYLDAGFIVVRDCILKWYQPFLVSFTEDNHHKDPKTLLQEYLQSRHLPLPIYIVDEVKGEAHQQIFIISCHVESLKKNTQAKGSSRRRAEQAAAEMMLGLIK